MPSADMHDEPARPARRDHHRPTSWRTLAAVAVLLALAAIAAVAPTVAARPSTAAQPTAAALPPTTDPPDPPDPPETTEPPGPPVTHPIPTPTPNPECDDAAGLSRPSGAVPPGYVYSPTKFDGTVKDPQPDDTFVADAVGHGAHTGRLRTRIVGGQEQLFVCAHVGTNSPEDALTPFPTTGTGAHAATIAPRVVLIGTDGAKTMYDYGAPGIEGTLSHYAGSSDVHEGYAQMWVPLPSTLKEPGFVVRVEIRGTSALAPGGSTKVMGADEVYVHVGQAPLVRNGLAGRAVGVALDASAIGERPTDPGPDDLSALLEPLMKPLISDRIRAFAPQDIDLGVDGELWGWSNVTFGSARLDSLGNTVRSATLDVENFNATEGRGVIDINATLFPHLTVSPRSIGLVTITGGSCQASATVDVHIRAGFEVDLSADGAKPVMKILFVTTSGTVQSVSVSGSLDVWWVGSMSCSNIESQVNDGIDDGMAERLQSLQGDLSLRAEVEKQVAEMLTPADLANGPLSNPEVDLPNKVGFQIQSLRYIPTAPAGHLAGDVEINTSGMNVAAAAAVADKGGTRFPYSYVPSQASDLVSSLRGRTRPGSGAGFDVGLEVSGATVNQLIRALTAGDPRSPILADGGTTATQALSNPLLDKIDVGLLDISTKVSGLNVNVFPAAAPMYLPTPPSGWPDFARSDVNVYVPSLRVAIPLPGVATMATDVRLGMTATIDRSNHLVPIARASKVDVAPRFLRLGSTTNAVTDPALDPGGIPAMATTAVKGSVPSAVGAALAPIQIPDLSVSAQHVHLDHLTVGTVGGGHLGAFVDVEPGSAPAAPPALATSWIATSGQPPTHLIAYVLPGGMPLDGDTSPARATWKITDANAPATAAPIYATPDGKTDALLIGPPAAGLTPTTDRCTGEQTVVAKVSATVTQDGVARTSSTTALYSWPGTPPVVLPPHCGQDEEPPPTTEPPDTIPPPCQAKPWLCDEQP